ncbi:MAG: hypothetical protein H0V61_01745 [Chitinophagales bacterium]|jgi:hypothetical protein|nr:hypothetical protein [Chitinophagales bacterium]
MAEVTNQRRQSELQQKTEEHSEKKVFPPRKNWIYESLDVSRWVHYQTVIHNLPFIFFLAILGILYIANTHYAEKNIRELSQIEKEMNELRWQYMTTKSQLEYMSKQSEVARLVEKSGLKELREPPRKIIIKDGR